MYIYVRVFLKNFTYIYIFFCYVFLCMWVFMCIGVYSWSHLRLSSASLCCTLLLLRMYLSIGGGSRGSRGSWKPARITWLHRNSIGASTTQGVNGRLDVNSCPPMSAVWHPPTYPRDQWFSFFRSLIVFFFFFRFGRYRAGRAVFGRACVDHTCTDAVLARSASARDPAEVARSQACFRRSTVLPYRPGRSSSKRLCRLISK